VSVYKTLKLRKNLTIVPPDKTGEKRRDRFSPESKKSSQFLYIVDKKIRGAKIIE